MQLVVTKVMYCGDLLLTVGEAKRKEGNVTKSRRGNWADRLRLTQALREASSYYSVNQSIMNRQGAIENESFN